MSFKVPLPTKRTKPDQRSRVIAAENGNDDLPSFSIHDFSDITLIGQGSYGKVLKCKKNENTYVIKELACKDSNPLESKLFRKEAELLKSLSGHDNIIQIFGFNNNENSMLVEFMTFDFSRIGIEHDPVFNLKEYLIACDSISDFHGFAHTQYFLAKDIIEGVSFLHSKGIAHRDLKPDNILVSNRHYEHCQESDITLCWNLSPIVAKLTDFGESRSNLIQTRTLAQTNTINLYRGSPAYMSPEALNPNAPGNAADIAGLQSMDIWSFGMVLYHLTSPNVRHPYELDLDQESRTSPVVQVKELMSRNIRPKQTPKYEDMRRGLWSPIAHIYEMCTNFCPTDRPNAKDISDVLVCSYVEVKSLLVSQESKTLETDVFSKDVKKTDDHTINACSFLCLLVANEIFRSGESVDVREITQNYILNFPPEVNALRSSEKHYSVDEAYDILRTCRRVSDTELTLEITSIGEVSCNDAKEQLARSLTNLVEQHEMFCAIYTIPPYAFLLFKSTSGQLSIIDTHPIPERCGGRTLAGIISASFPEYSIVALVNWLQKRTDSTRPIYHELTLLVPKGETDGNLPDGDNSTLEVNIETAGSIDEFHTDCYEYSYDIEVDNDNIERRNMTTVSSSTSIEANTNQATTNSQYSDDHKSMSEMNPIRKRRYSNKELDPALWDGCKTEHVERIQFDVDGLRKFSLSANEQDMMAKTKDGRNWGTWVTSSRKGFNGKRRVARCKGSPKCPSDSCPYRSLYGSANRVQFEKRDSIKVCFTCGTPSEDVFCNASKIWEYSNNSNQVTVMYIGSHSCIPKPPKISKQHIKNEIENHPGVKPSQLVNEKMVELMSMENFKWSSVDEVAYNFVDMKRIHNIREEMRAEKHPAGENFEALGIYKAKCDEKDPFLIYKINNRALNGNPSYVFKSSKEMAELALEMDIDGKGCLKDEYAYVDAKHNRCRGFKTITLWTFHPLLRKLLCLAKMEAEEESSENLIQFWENFNEILRAVSKQQTYNFNPLGIIADEHHANWNSIATVFGEQLVRRSASCEFHYKQSVQRHSKKLVDHAEEFITLSNHMLQALTPADYESAFNKMTKFSQNHPSIQHWLSWWHDRRSHIFKAFKPFSAPASNLAEVGHAKMSSVGRCYMSLLEAARHDVASAIRQSTEVRLFSNGLSKGGRGTNVNRKRAKQYKEGLKLAHAYAGELDDGNIPGDLPALCVPKTGRHRPTEKRTKVRTSSEPEEPCVPVADHHPPSQHSLSFHLKFFGNIINLKVCYGCKKTFKDKHKREPNDMILQYYCHRTFRDKQGNIRQSKNLQAAYFHLKLDCVRRVVPRMELSDIIISSETEQRLTDGHKNVLMKIGLPIRP